MDDEPKKPIWNRPFHIPRRQAAIIAVIAVVPLLLYWTYFNIPIPVSHYSDLDGLIGHRILIRATFLSGKPDMVGFDGNRLWVDHWLGHGRPRDGQEITTSGVLTEAPFREAGIRYTLKDAVRW